MNITSQSFKGGERIPSKYTCDGENVNPQLSFHGIPGDAKSLALIMDDPDAPSGTFTHWLLWDISAETNDIAEATEIKTTTGTNDFGNIGYGGPCPPKGEEHHYYFRLYALDTLLDLSAGSNHEQLNLAMSQHILDEAELIGTYKRIDE